ncbi:MFS transporter [Nonomuraea sp. 10N515B]|uniref:MFS transporter n=1 Tax=Nonomuraea sp. 10N515B TaxID=3457422 RepID=UPI003FCD8B53
MTDTASSRETPQTPPSKLRKVIAASMAGTVVEWYDFFIYGTAATLVFGKVFFPNTGTELDGIIAALLTYAVGFAARPLGGLVFGHFGDKLGRKRLLQVSLLIIGISTFCIGLLPTYAQVGVLAPVLLVVLRFAQGFALGGEWGGAVLLVSEHGTAERRGLWASFPQAAVPAGNMLATIVLTTLVAVMDEASFLAWGWRVAFLASAVLVIIGYYIRTHIEDAPIFKSAVAKAASEAEHRSPIAQVFRERPRQVFTAMGLRVAENIQYYMVVTFSITYLKVEVKADTERILLLMLVAHFIHLFAVPAMGALSDRIGRRPVIAVGVAGMAVWGAVAWSILDTDEALPIIAILTAGLVVHALMYGPQAAFMSEMFPTRMRYTGISMGYQVTSIFAGSLAPIIAAALLSSYGTGAIFLYMLIAVAISGVALLMARETRGVDLTIVDAQRVGVMS